MPVRSFGSEVGMPTVPEITGWLKEVKVVEADLTTYRLGRSIDAQEGVTVPAAGGIFYSERLRGAFPGVIDGVLVGEPDVDPAAVVADAHYILTRQKGAWISLPAPHMLGVRDGYIGDEEGFSEAIATSYIRLMREMRDAGVQGHILIADEADAIELDLLAKRKTLFFPRAPETFDLELLLEYQDRLILPAKDLNRAEDLMERFHIKRLILLDAETEDLAAATALADPDMLEVGGYCEENCPDYWKRLRERVFILR